MSMGTDEGTIQLVGGLGLNEGRVEIFFHGHWGTLCGNYDWDILDAIVACRQLGYHTAEAAVVAQFGIGSGPNWMRSIQCTGYETNLTQCNIIIHAEHNVMQVSYVPVSLCKQTYSYCRMDHNRSFYDFHLELVTATIMHNSVCIM